MISSPPRRSREPDRVRRYTSEFALAHLDEATANSVRYYAAQSPEAIDERLHELQHEWTIERTMQLNITALGLGSLALAVVHDRRWAWLTLGGLVFFFGHAVCGFDPPLRLMRRRNLRTRREVDREFYALKFLRGDFDAVRDSTSLSSSPPRASIPAALRAVGL